MSSPVERASSIVEASASATVERTNLGMRTKTRLSLRAWKMATSVISAFWDSWLCVIIGRLEFSKPVQVEHFQNKRRYVV